MRIWKRGKRGINKRRVGNMEVSKGQDVERRATRWEKSRRDEQRAREIES